LKNTFNSFRVGCKEAITKQRVYCQAHSASYCALTGCTASWSLGLIPSLQKRFISFRSGCKEVPSPSDGLIAKHIQPVD
jgi:hypothetical protein